MNCFKQIRKDDPKQNASYRLKTNLLAVCNCEDAITRGFLSIARETRFKFVV